MSANIDFILKAGGVLLEPVANIALDPTRMVSSKNMHLGYEPLTGDEAFELERNKKHPWLYNDYFNSSHRLLIARGTVECERLVGLCYKFICLNRGIDIIVPREEFLNCIPLKSIFESTIIFNTPNGRQAKIQIYIRASIRVESEREVEEYVVNANRLYGNPHAHNQLFENLKSYIDSDGHIDPRIRSKVSCASGYDSDDDY